MIQQAAAPGGSSSGGAAHPPSLHAVRCVFDSVSRSQVLCVPAGAMIAFFDTSEPSAGGGGVRTSSSKNSKASEQQRRRSQLPLSAPQRILAIQFYVQFGAARDAAVGPVSLELSLKDRVGVRRLLFTTSVNVVQSHAQHVKIPMGGLLPDGDTAPRWVNLYWDLSALHEAFFAAGGRRRGAPADAPPATTASLPPGGGYRLTQVRLHAQGSDVYVRRLLALHRLPPTPLEGALQPIVQPIPFQLPDGVPYRSVMVRSGLEEELLPTPRGGPSDRLETDCRGSRGGRRGDSRRGRPREGREVAMSNRNGSSDPPAARRGHPTNRRSYCEGLPAENDDDTSRSEEFLEGKGGGGGATHQEMPADDSRPAWQRPLAARLRVSSVDSHPPPPRRAIPLSLQGLRGGHTAQLRPGGQPYSTAPSPRIFGAVPDADLRHQSQSMVEVSELTLAHDTSCSTTSGSVGGTKQSLVEEDAQPLYASRPLHTRTPLSRPPSVYDTSARLYWEGDPLSTRPASPPLSGSMPSSGPAFAAPPPQRPAAPVSVVEPTMNYRSALALMELMQQRVDRIMWVLDADKTFQPGRPATVGQRPATMPAASDALMPTSRPAAMVATSDAPRKVTVPTAGPGGASDPIVRPAGPRVFPPWTTRRHSTTLLEEGAGTVSVGTEEAPPRFVDAAVQREDALRSSLDAWVLSEDPLPLTPRFKHHHHSRRDRATTQGLPSRHGRDGRAEGAAPAAEIAGTRHAEPERLPPPPVEEVIAGPAKASTSVTDRLLFDSGQFEVMMSSGPQGFAAGADIATTPSTPSPADPVKGSATEQVPTSTRTSWTFQSSSTVAVPSTVGGGGQRNGMLSTVHYASPGATPANLKTPMQPSVVVAEHGASASVAVAPATKGAIMDTPDTSLRGEGGASAAANSRSRRPPGLPLTPLRSGSQPFKSVPPAAPPPSIQLSRVAPLPQQDTAATVVVASDTHRRAPSRSLAAPASDGAGASPVERSPRGTPPLSEAAAAAGRSFHPPPPSNGFYYLAMSEMPLSAVARWRDRYRTSGVSMLEDEEFTSVSTRAELTHPPPSQQPQEPSPPPSWTPAPFTVEDPKCENSTRYVFDPVLQCYLDLETNMYVEADASVIESAPNPDGGCRE